MDSASVIGGLCLAAAVGLGLATPVYAGNGCIPFFDKGEFEAFNASEGKFLKGIEDFEESNIPPGGKQFLPAPLQGSIPNVDPITGFGFPDGLLQKNLIILDNITQGPNPPRTNPSGSDLALYVIGAGFLGSNSKKVGEDLFLKGIHASLDLLFTEPNHSGIGFELSRFSPDQLFGWHVTVYNKNDDVIGKFQVPPPTGPEPNKSFFGIWCFESIGRINIFDKAGPLPDAIDDIQMWVDDPGNPPGCPWDCASPFDNSVGILDFLALLSQWGMIGTTCDFDGGGVGIVDFLKLLANWGPCPPPANDECPGAEVIDRLDQDERILVHFDLSRATPSPEPYKCLTLPPVNEDLWYCLQNNTNREKHVSLRTDVPLFIEVNDGCFCPPGPLIACDTTFVKFLMFPGQQVTIRLINDLGLPPDALKGTLFITNNPVPPDARFCPPGSNYSQIPHQPTEAWTFGASDLQPRFKRYEDFLHDGRFIDQLVFWGADVWFDPMLGDFVECDIQKPFFSINFYQDDGTGFPLKDDPICTYFVQATEKAFKDFYQRGTFIVNAWRYTVDLNPQCRLPAGTFWVSIQGAGGGGPNDPNNCWFFWLSSPDSNLPGSVFENSNTGEQLFEPFDLSLCIIGKDPVPTTRCGQCGEGPHWIDTCPGGNDVIAPADHSAMVSVDLTLDCIPDADIPMAGVSNLLIRKEGKLDDSLQFPGLRLLDGHLDVMDTEILTMELAGGGLILRVGKNQGGILFPSLGAIAEDLVDPNIGNSFFDVFFEIDLGGGAFAYNQVPVRVEADITCAPPRANYRHLADCIPLFSSPVPGQGILLANLISANHFVFEPPDNPFGCTDDPANGDCCIDNGTPFCDNVDCCRRVCEIDPFCCQTAWDQICADEAAQFPQCGCPPPGDDKCEHCGPNDRRNDFWGGGG